ncbi:prop effector, partial [Escherichia coli]|nr:prop effector [Escherichia coli]
GPRYDLNGQPCGEVTEEDKSVASELLKRRLAQIKQQNSQQQTTGDDGDDS